MKNHYRCAKSQSSGQPEPCQEKKRQKHSCHGIIANEAIKRKPFPIALPLLWRQQKALGAGAAVLARKTLMLLKGVGKMIRSIIT